MRFAGDMWTPSTTYVNSGVDSGALRHFEALDHPDIDNTYRSEASGIRGLSAADLRYNGLATLLLGRRGRSSLGLRRFCPPGPQPEAVVVEGPARLRRAVSARRATTRLARLISVPALRSHSRWRPWVAS